MMKPIQETRDHYPNKVLSQIENKPNEEEGRAESSTNKTESSL